ncbi:MAG: phospholipid transport system substrate-binding protein [Alphaproteobacteria bacterium]|nr:phospholipid transport system substrate-binding protein [Alphaproteobacteria bacterium]
MNPAKFWLPAIWMAASTMLLPALSPVDMAQAQAVARVEAGQAKRFIADLGAQAINVLRADGHTIEQREAIFRDMLMRKFSMPFIGRFVLGRYWQSATIDQQEEYLALFSEFVLRNYASMLGGYAGETFEVLNAAEAGKSDMIVSSRVSGGGREPLGVDWRLRMIDDQPQIIDVSVGGISMSITQREEYSALVQRNGMAGLIEALRARTNSLPAEGP